MLHNLSRQLLLRCCELKLWLKLHVMLRTMLRMSLHMMMRMMLPLARDALQPSCSFLLPTSLVQNFLCAAWRRKKAGYESVLRQATVAIFELEMRVRASVKCCDFRAQVARNSADPFLERRGAWEGFVFVLVFAMIILTTDVG